MIIKFSILPCKLADLLFPEELGMFDSQRETDGKMKMEQTSDR